MEKYFIADYGEYGRKPVIRQMSDGTIICLSLTGGETEPRPENYVAITRSYDRGKTWSKVEKLFSHESFGVWCTEIFTDCEVPFAAVHTYALSKPHAQRYMELNSYFSYTSDNGKTWSVPSSIPGCAGRCSFRQGFRLSNGDIFFPVYWDSIIGNLAFTVDGKKSDSEKLLFRCGAVISSDNGKTWAEYGYIAYDDQNLWEPNAVELEDGHIIMYCRSSKGYLVASESFDYGRTWTKPYTTDIPNADTKVTVLKRGGKIYMINNFNPVPEWLQRNHLWIAESTDGKTFTKIANIENDDEWVFYPHAFFDENERILYVAYENFRQHFLKKFTFDELGITD